MPVCTQNTLPRQPRRLRQRRSTTIRSSSRKMCTPYKYKSQDISLFSKWKCERVFLWVCMCECIRGWSALVCWLWYDGMSRHLQRHIASTLSSIVYSSHISTCVCASKCIPHTNVFLSFVHSFVLHRNYSSYMPKGDKQRERIQSQ